MVGLFLLRKAQCTSQQPVFGSIGRNFKGLGCVRHPQKKQQLHDVTAPARHACTYHICTNQKDETSSGRSETFQSPNSKTLTLSLNSFSFYCVRGMSSTTRQMNESQSESDTEGMPLANTHSSKWTKFLSIESIQAPASFNRWLLLPPAVLAHMALGSVYAWSILNSSFVRNIGVVGSAADDWSLSDVVPIFAVICGVHGLSAALFGRWQERVGPRYAGLLGALTFGSGFFLSSFGVHLHNLPTAYAGGILIGCGIGLSYVPPVATLLRWFPDRRGLATGLTLMGFGGGAIFASPAMTSLMKTFQMPPDYLGSSSNVSVITENGKKLVEIGDKFQEVVLVSEKTMYRLPFQDLLEGVYVAGTGSTGVSLALMTLGVTYFAALSVAALSYRGLTRLPPSGYTPPLPENRTTDQPPTPRKPKGVVTNGHVHIDNVMKTPQFWHIWMSFCAVGSTGMAVLSVANDMILETFEASMPELVTLGFASTYIMALSAANLGGRVAWATISDYIGLENEIINLFSSILFMDVNRSCQHGELTMNYSFYVYSTYFSRKRTYAIFTGLSVPLYLSLPLYIQSSMTSPSILPLVGFYGTTMLLISLFGGAYSTTPAYEADVFGTKFVGATHGRMLTASAVGGLLGPTFATVLRDFSERSAIRDITAKVDASRFQQEFGCSPTEIDTLIQSKSITLSRVMSIAPSDIPDPTPLLYNSTLYSAAALLTLASCANLLVKPVDSKFLMPVDQDSSSQR
eukprot:gene2537-5457_t